MLKRVALALALCLLSAFAWADGVSSPNSPPAIGFKGARVSFPGTVINTYVGPGDALTGAAAWWGLRAYNGAYATSLGNAIQVRRASDNTTQNVPVLFSGTLNVASANTFAGTDATCTGTIASTTATLTSCSATPKAGDTVSSGVGITQPSFIVSCGTFTSGAGTCTLNAAQTVSSAETIVFQVALYAAQLYDQTGNGWTLAQATAGNQALFLPICLNSLPCLYFNGSSDAYLNTAGNISLIMSVYMVMQPLGPGAFVPFGNMQTATNNTGNYGELAGSTNTPQAATVVSGSFSGTGGVSGAMNTSWGVAAWAWNNSIAGDRTAFTNGVQGNTDAVSLNPTTQNSTSIGARYTTGTPGVFFLGNFAETGEWGSYFLNPNQTTLCHNAYTYWGTATSC